MATYFYSRNGEKSGPFSAEQFKTLAVTGKLLPSDLVWKEGMPQWVSAASVKGLLQAASAAIVPPTRSTAGAVEAERANSIYRPAHPRQQETTPRITATPRSGVSSHTTRNFVVGLIVAGLGVVCVVAAIAIRSVTRDRSSPSEDTSMAANGRENAEPRATDDRRAASATTENASASPPRRVTATSNDDAPRLFTEQEMKEICEKARTVKLGTPVSDVTALIGTPHTKRTGGDQEFLVWRMDEQELRLAVTVGIVKGKVQSLNCVGAVVFDKPDMTALLKVAQTLRRGESHDAVVSRMGHSTGVNHLAQPFVVAVDSVTEEVTTEENTLSLLTWVSADSPDRFIIVGLKDGVVTSVECHQPGRGAVYELD